MGDQWVITRDLEYAFDADLKDDYGGVWRDAWVKWDGCVQFVRYFNAPKDIPDRNADDMDNIHLCSVARTVGELIDLLKLAESKLEGEWHGEAHRLDEVLAARGWVKPK